MASTFTEEMSKSNQETTISARSQTSCNVSPDSWSRRDRLLEYFEPRIPYQKDWQVLASQSINSTLKLEPTACDPLRARLVDQSDVELYFELFFKFRNPFVGLLDPALHTSEYVYSASFTLFSVICALGCAISVRPRDRILYSALLSLAETNVMWSIAASVKSLEVIQAIINMKYWAPVHQRQTDDPYWLHLSHAAQLARELGIHTSTGVSSQISTVAPGAAAHVKERLQRNFERTWLHVCIADKSFGIITGRSMGVAWNELPTNSCQWWRKPMTTTLDRMISGVMEIRIQLLTELKRLERLRRTVECVVVWHSQALDTLERTRNIRCYPDGPQSAPNFPILAFYIDHSIMVLNTQALRELAATEEAEKSTELEKLSRKAFDVAMRLLDLAHTNPLIRELKFGWQNNQFIMVAHAMTEIIQAIRRDNLPFNDVVEATSRVHAVSEHLEGIAEESPATSAAHIYASLTRMFISRLNTTNVEDGDAPQGPNIDANISVPGWLRGSEAGSLDPAAWFQMGFLNTDDSGLDLGDIYDVVNMGDLTFAPSAEP
ncbi:prib protein [Colletotrichum truncatum]|uniref:Prib protein n=1 Tax=Colletotrichum truncatum TaxID=5467 RepID=A0ACC3YV17_COLTU